MVRFVASCDAGRRGAKWHELPIISLAYLGWLLDIGTIMAGITQLR